ncbi:MAG TPA: hypothetical protein DCM05_01190 [Elusimicrobia bacterium]|nr:hypothetical protein [Elusimicrobiota bacterium]
MLWTPLRYLAKAFVGHDTPRQMAAGFALGLLAGLVPKASLLSQLVLALIAATQVSLAAGYGAAALASLLSPLLDPLTHRLGWLLLVDAEGLAPLWAWLYDLPIVPWTGFNNTVTLGSFVLGLALAFPAYKLSEPVFAKYQASWGARIRKLKLVELLLGAELAGKAGG